MKLCAIYNVWSDWELFKHSLYHMLPMVDGYILVASERSNYGEFSEIPDEWIDKNCIIYEPNGLAPMQSETHKRNLGINKARDKGYTHFVMMDADEFYDPKEFIEAKETIGEKHGLVCRSKVYFGSPDLTIGYDTTLVPFIHKLTPSIRCTFNKNYPFAWTDEDGVHWTKKKRIRIDPTRSYNINTGVFWSDVTMHHYSWVRDDYQKKIRNSTARNNLERSTILNDLVHAKEGYYCEFYRKTLVPATVDFGICLNSTTR